MRGSVVSAAGRRAGWVGIVELSSDDDGLVGSAWERGSIERQDGPAPNHVAGPYYAAHAVAVPVGERHVVVFGSAEPIIGSEIEFVGRAAAEVDDARGVSADKLLADELEVVQALRDLMAYRPLTVRDTALHVAQVAARALSCDVAVVRLSVGDRTLVEGLDLRSAEALPRPDPSGHLSTVPERATVAQVAEPDPDLFGVDVVSHLVLPLPGSIPARSPSATRPKGPADLPRSASGSDGRSPSRASCCSIRRRRARPCRASAMPWPVWSERTA